MSDPLATTGAPDGPPLPAGPVVVDVLRHGEPVGGRRYRGNGIDDPLSRAGEAQMWRAVGELRPWDRIVSSPMRRCHDFAQALAAEMGLAVAVEPRFREVGFGAWEGRTADQVRAADPEGFERFYRDPLRCRPPGAEPLEDFTARVGAAFEALAADGGGRHVLVVAHAGVIRASVARVLGLPLERLYRIAVPYAGVTRFRREVDRLLLDFHGLPVLPPPQ